MPNVTPFASHPGHPLPFRRHWWRTAIPAAFAVVMFGLFVHHVPAAVGVAVPSLGLLLLLCAALHGGVTVSREGIAWYILRPKWRYRVIPWSAVLDVRKSLFGLNPVRLIVEHRRYEPWVWGTEQPDRRSEVEVWPNGYAGGEALWDTIHRYWSLQNRGIGLTTTEE